MTRSRLGFGCSGAWALPATPRAKAVRLVRQALDKGVRLFDTAPFYADGDAERRLGAALREAGSAADDVVISTKTGTQPNGFGRKRKDFSANAVRKDVETSLANLGRERIDLLFLHGPSTAQLDGVRATLDALIQEGKVAAAGVCGDGAELTHAVRYGGFAAIMAPYNVLHREHEPAFAAAKAARMQTFAVAPLAQALYRNALFAPRSGADLWYLVRAVLKNRSDLAVARRLNAAPAPEGWSRAQLALAFVLRCPHVNAAFINTTRPAHLDEAIAVLEKEPPTGVFDAMLAALDGVRTTS